MLSRLVRKYRFGCPYGMHRVQRPYAAAMATGVREPVAAGSLYAADSQELRTEIDASINSAHSEFTSPKLLIVPDHGLAAAPHVAGNGMIMLESERDHVKRVIIISDYRPGIGGREIQGIAVPRAIAFRTPLGDLLTDRVAIDSLHGHPSVVTNDRPFEKDTSIEVHLPPIQRLLGAVRIIPILVGEASVAEVVDVLERLWGSRDTLLVVSSSFGSGTDPEEVGEQGEAIRSALLRGELASLARTNMSAPKSLAAAMTIVGRRSMGLLELASDTIEDPYGGDEVFNVGALAAWESTDMALAEADAEHLRALARAAVELTVLGGRVEGSNMGRVPPALAARRASVVTLRHNGQTRGSAGTIEADRALAGSVVRNAAAACADPRLPSIQPAELADLQMTISIVSPTERIFPQTPDELSQMLEVGRHGVLVTSPAGRAAQLPAMWSRLQTHEAFIGMVAKKAHVSTPDGISSAAWYRFETIDY
jgi:AmmeMemoRadiSam system protein B